MNGTKVGIITTDNAAPFTAKSVTATFVSGSNVVELQDSEGTGEPDVDYLEVSDNVSCTPLTCATAGAACGSVSNGCGGTLSCGTCAGGATCNSSNQCVAPSGACASNDLTTSTTLVTAASSTAGTNTSAKAIDNSLTTRYESTSIDPTTLSIDLGSKKKINRVKIDWETANARDYRIEVSDDNVNWSTLVSKTGMPAFGNHRIDDLTGLDGAGRYVRMYGTVRNTPYGYSIYEMDAYGDDNPSCGGTTASCGGTCAMGQNCVNNACVAGTSTYYNAGKTLEATPNFGPNVKVFTPADSSATIQTYIEGVYNGTVPANSTPQHTNQFGLRRDAIFFTPGAYSTHMPIGFNTQIAGLGDHPDAVSITGYAEAPPDFLPSNNGTQTFWRVVENFKLSKPIASSSGNGAGAFDNDATTTRWTSNNGVDPSWVQIDLGAPKFINRVRLDWEAANAKDYNISVSTDGINFTTLVTKTAMATGNHRIDDLTGLSGTGRYVRLTGTARNTTYGYSLWEMDVYGDAAGCTTCASNDLTPSPVLSGDMLWAVSQAAPMRRFHATDSVALHRGYGWESGGFIADSKIDSYLLLGSQQQWYTRNSDIANAVEGTWNIMFQGTLGTRYQAAFPTGPLTEVANTPVIREKPFMFVDRDGKYNVFAPAIRTNAVGTSWSGTQAGTSIPLSNFYIAKEGTDTATTMNAALAAGKHLLITPGVYHLSAPLAVNNANTIVLGMGLATLVPDNGVKAITVADVDGVKIAGLILDAGTVSSPVLLEVGPTGASASHSANPTSLHDIFTRIGGGTWIGKADVSLKINSNDVLVDHIWLWRADHSDTPNVTGWYVNTAKNGLIVNGNNVTAYGTFVEHFQEYEVLWNGNNGRNYFLQNEMPYDARQQSDWNTAGNGWASYKVASTVTNHEAWGMGCYAVFTMNSCTVATQATDCVSGVCDATDLHCTAPPTVSCAGGTCTPVAGQTGMLADRAIEVPDAQLGVKLHNMVSLSLTTKGKISNLLNSNGMAANAADFSTYPELASYH